MKGIIMNTKVSGEIERWQTKGGKYAIILYTAKWEYNGVQYFAYDFYTNGSFTGGSSGYPTLEDAKQTMMRQIECAARIDNIKYKQVV